MKQKLLPFYFGSLGESERLEIERELLADPEILLEYLDLKREIEAAQAIPSRPSSEVLRKLLPNKLPQRRTVLSLSIGAAIAAGLALFLNSQPSERTVEEAAPSQPIKILFDSSAELPASSSVL